MANSIQLETDTIHSTGSVQVRLTDDEIRSGIVMEIQAAQAAARLQAIRDMSQAYAATLRRKYGLGDEYQLTDWISGFVKE